MKRFFIGALLLVTILTPLTGRAEASNLIYETLTNEQLGISLQYPVGWIANPGTATICFLESTAKGVLGGRMAVTCKEVKSAQSAEDMENQLSAYSGSIASLYSRFDVTETTTDSQFLNTRAGSLLYSAESDGTPISGYVIMTCVNRRIYAFHFSCPTDRFDAMSGAIQTLRDGVALLNAE